MEHDRVISRCYFQTSAANLKDLKRKLIKRYLPVHCLVSGKAELLFMRHSCAYTMLVRDWGPKSLPVKHGIWREEVTGTKRGKTRKKEASRNTRGSFSGNILLLKQCIPKFSRGRDWSIFPSGKFFLHEVNKLTGNDFQYKNNSYLKY